MTARLIALMTAVLVLCLAVFAGLMIHYQRGVMSEVERIVGEMGRATVGSMHVAMFQSPAESDDEARLHRWVEDALGETKPGSGGGEVWFLNEGEPPQRIVFGSSGKSDPRTVKKIIAELRLPDGSVHRETREVRLRSEDVRTAFAPGKGLVLRIPGLDADPSATIAGATKRRAPPPSHPIELLVPTEELQALAADTRRTSLILFISVLVVGSGLAAAFAHRFTRPMRRLDAGLRQLSAGHLEVEVEVAGDDEFGRLGKAFNEMSRELRSARDRERDLARREKLAALGRLAAGVAHDVRNPLHSIGLTLQHLEETCRPADASRSEFDHATALIRTEIDRLDQLITNFLGFATTSASEREKVAPSALLDEIARLVEREARRRDVTLAVASDPATPPIVVDRAAIRAAILNLVLNALEAVAEGGHIGLSAMAEGSSVRIAVQDDGRGIAAVDQERVFEFGFSTRPDGHGLGLAMVHQVVVEDHGGQVTIASSPGDGTTVAMTFPAALELHS